MWEGSRKSHLGEQGEGGRGKAVCARKEVEKAQREQGEVAIKRKGETR